jgi:hypothetical protein
VCTSLFTVLHLGEGDDGVCRQDGSVVNADEELAGAQCRVRQAPEAPEKREVVLHVADGEMVEEHRIGFRDGLGFALWDQ